MRGLLFLLITICLGCNPLNNDVVVPTVIDGIIDLRNYDFAYDGSVRLNGDWVYDSSQLTLHKFGADRIDYASLPGIWNDDLREGTPSGNGYASYHLQLLLPEEPRHMGMEIPYVYSAFKVYIDSVLVADNGVVGTTLETHKSQFSPKSISFTASGIVNLSIQVSNFEDRKGGIWATPKIGLAKDILSSWTTGLAAEFFMIGALFIIGFYQVSLFVMRREDRSTLYFGIFCLILSIRSLLVGSVLMNHVFPMMSWLSMARLEYVLIFSMTPLFMFFIDALFPGHISTLLKKISVGFFVLISIFILSTTKAVFGQLLVVIPIAVLLNGIPAFYSMYKAYQENHRGAVNSIIGTLVLFAAAANDILYSLELIHTDNYLSYGVLVFIIIQSLNIAYIFGKAFEDVKSLTQNLQLTNISYSRFVPAAFLSFLGKKDITSVKLGDQRRADMSILFADIRSFTELSETMSPQDNFNFINSFFKNISPVIRKNDGFVDKFIGDAIMSLFPNKPENAIDAAIGMHRALASYNETRVQKGRTPVRIGIGINTGSVMLGTVGEEERMDTTVISDAVNLAARLEGLSKVYNTPILTTLSTLNKLKNKDDYQYRILHKGKVKGRSEIVTIVEIISVDTDPLASQKLATRQDYQLAIDHYHGGEYGKAISIFQSVSLLLPNDHALLNYIERCTQFLTYGVPVGFDGVEALDFKQK